MKSTLITMCVLFLASCVSTGTSKIGLPQSASLPSIDTQNPPMVILNYLVAKYDDILFYPLIFCTGLISVAWTYKTIKQILQEKRQ